MQTDVKKFYEILSFVPNIPVFSDVLYLKGYLLVAKSTISLFDLNR